jgi:hypothetical protein
VTLLATALCHRVGTAEWWYSRVEFRHRQLVGVRAGHEDRDRKTELYVLTADGSWEAKEFLRVFPSRRTAQ